MKLNFSWTSKRLYVYGQHTGNVAYDGKLDKYFIVDSADRMTALEDQDFGRKCHEIEIRLNTKTGRPRLFPHEACSVKLITLPDYIWKALGEAPAISIVELIEKANPSHGTEGEAKNSRGKG